MDVSNTTLILGFLGTMATSVIVPLATRWLDLQDRKQKAAEIRQQALDDAAALREHTTNETNRQTAQLSGALTDLKAEVNGKLTQFIKVSGDAREAVGNLAGHAEERANPT